MTPEDAREVARETVNELFDRFGVDLTNRDHVEEFRRDLQFARKQRKGAEDIGKAVRFTAVGAFVTGALWALFYGLQKVFGGGG